MAPNPPFADALARFVFEHAAVRGALVSLDGACREILDCHPYPPALRRVLAELLAAATLLASTLKFKGALIVQLQGDGPVRLLVVECDATLSLRATAQWKEAAAALPAVGVARGARRRRRSTAASRSRSIRRTAVRSTRASSRWRRRRSRR